MESATIKLFLANGKPNGLRTAEILNWSIKAIAASRSEISEFLKRDELKNSCVYFLIGKDDEDLEKDKIYIGETESIITRIKNHDIQKDFWNQVIVFVSKDDNLTKGHIQYLEGKLINIAKNSIQVKLDNGQNSGSNISESDTADMNIFCEKILQLLPILGVTTLNQNDNLNTNISREEYLYYQVGDINAKALRVTDGIKVLKDSQAKLNPNPNYINNQTYLNRKNRLIESEIIKEVNGKFIFQKDYVFKSPSGASSFIYASSSNGRVSWKNKNGKTLAEIEEN